MLMILKLAAAMISNCQANRMKLVKIMGSKIAHLGKKPKLGCFRNLIEE
jgi:hypothetical protein